MHNKKAQLNHEIQPWRGITITFKRGYERLPYPLQFKYTKDLLYEIIKWDYFILIPEFTELGRIHYHGKFKITDELKHFKTMQSISLKCGFKKLENIKYPPLWDEYINKSVGVSSALIKSDNVELSPMDRAQYNRIKQKKILTQIRDMETFIKESLQFDSTNLDT